MSMAERARTKGGRKAASSWLRVLAALVALVLSAGAVGQAAHFLLVPHAICAEHGELLELDEAAAHQQREHESATDASQPHASQAELAGDHEHCQVLARGQRELALPQAGSAQLLPAAHSADAPSALDSPNVTPQQERLALAPKTSPPPAPGC